MFGRSSRIRYNRILAKMISQLTECFQSDWLIEFHYRIFLISNGIQSSSATITFQQSQRTDSQIDKVFGYGYVHDIHPRISVHSNTPMPVRMPMPWPLLFTTEEIVSRFSLLLSLLLVVLLLLLLLLLVLLLLLLLLFNILLII